MIKVGTKAPDFALKDQNGKTVKLSGSGREEGAALVPASGLDGSLS